MMSETRVKFNILIGRWAIRICVMVIIFFIAVLAIKWFIHTSDTAKDNKKDIAINTEQIENNKDRIEVLEATPTPTPKVGLQRMHHYHATPRKSLWDRIFHP